MLARTTSRVGGASPPQRGRSPRRVHRDPRGGAAGRVRAVLMPLDARGLAVERREPGMVQVGDEFIRRPAAGGVSLPGGPDAGGEPGVPGESWQATRVPPAIAAGSRRMGAADRARKHELDRHGCDRDAFTTEPVHAHGRTKPDPPNDPRVASRTVGSPTEHGAHRPKRPRYRRAPNASQVAAGTSGKQPRASARGRAAAVPAGERRPGPGIERPRSSGVIPKSHAKPQPRMRS